MDEERPRVVSKRRRSVSSASSSSSDSQGADSPGRSPSLSPPPKYHRASTSPGPSSRPFLCTLPPTCSQAHTSSSYATQSELERHQEAFHRWICRVPVRDRSDFTASEIPQSFATTKEIKKGQRWKECGKAFPDERLLTLHHTETHDPLARESQQRGERIFECFLPESQCKRIFLTPARRRRHMIDKHRYPTQYFFAITNHGINKLVEEEGLAMSLLRPRRDRPPRERHETDGKLETQPPPIKPDTHGLPSTNAGPKLAETAHKGESNGGIDVDMDEIVEKLGGEDSSLRFTPRGVRKKDATKMA